jgi:hypothetical protein
MGSPIHISFRSQLTAHRGMLRSREPGCGIGVYAASFIKKRKIIVDRHLLKQPQLLRLIVVHELFHFVWPRLGNGARKEFAELLAQELAQRARGELGESAAVKKSMLGKRDCGARSSQWREYVCESFCDTAAWRYSGVKQNCAFTLALLWRKRRKLWFDTQFADCCKC